MNPTIEAEAGLQNHRVVSDSEWIEARKSLLKKEKELTRQRDALSAEIRALPWRKIEKEYVFEGPNGPLSLSDLFEGRSQLVVYHFMYGPGWKEGCPGCSFLADHIDGANLHLAHHDVKLLAVSRAPFQEFQGFKKRMGWHFTWVSSNGSDFNYDFNVSFREGEEGTYNYEPRPAGEEGEGPGISVFYKAPSGEIYHTYSAYARGGDIMIGAHNWLDLTPKGRNESEIMDWMRLHDEYETIQPRFEEGKPLWIAGLERRYTFQEMPLVPQLWQEFVPFLGQIPNQVGMTTYGLCSMIDGGFRYLAGVEVDALDALPDRFAGFRLPARRYAVFEHPGTTADLCETIDAIYKKWLPSSGVEVLPEFFERYGPGFDPVAMRGDIEIWLPLKD